MPENTVKVDRSTPYGNDFTVEDYRDAETVVELFDHDLDKFECFHPDKYRRWIAPLVGKSLACWCKPDAVCHADVLLRRAAEYEAARDMGSRVAAQVPQVLREDQ
jgi:hypothetical protein